MGSDCGGTIFKVLVGGDRVSTGTGSYCCHGAYIVSHCTWMWHGSGSPHVVHNYVAKSLINNLVPLQTAVAYMHAKNGKSNKFRPFDAYHAKPVVVMFCNKGKYPSPVSTL